MKTTQTIHEGDFAILVDLTTSNGHDKLGPDRVDYSQTLNSTTDTGVAFTMSDHGDGVRLDVLAVGQGQQPATAEDVAEMLEHLAHTLRQVHAGADSTHNDD